MEGEAPISKPWYKNGYVWLGLVLGLIGFAIYWQFFRVEPVIYQVEEIEKRDIKQIVSVTGTVNADPKVDLNFQLTGKIGKVFKEVGDAVEIGDIIAELENDAQSIAVDRAKAELHNVEAQLARELAGSKIEEIRVAEAQVRQAESDLKLAELEIQNVQRLSQKNIEQAELRLEERRIDDEKADISLTNIRETSAEKIKSAEKEVESAKANLRKAEVELKNTLLTSDKDINDAYEDLYPSMNNALLSIGKNLTEADAILRIDNENANDEFKDYIGALKKQLLSDAYNQYVDTIDAYDILRRDFNFIDSNDRDALEAIYPRIKEVLEETDKLMDIVWEVLDGSIVNANFPQSTLDTFKDTIDAEHNDLITARDAMVSKHQSITTALLNSDTSDEQKKADFEVAQNALIVAEQTLRQIQVESESNIKTTETDVKDVGNLISQADKDLQRTKTESNNSLASARAQRDVAASKLQNARANLALVKSGPRDVDTETIRANIEQAKANLRGAEYDLERTRIIAPIAGIVAKVNIEEGETYTGTTSTDTGLPVPAIVILSEKALKVEADVSETDIAKLSLNDPVSLTFDAFPASRTFAGKVIHIDPSETLVSGVVYYRIETAFDIEYEDVKSGMTANLDILTDERSNVLSVPIRSVLFDGDIGKIKVYEGDQVVDKEIKLGLEGDTYIEVVEGLEEGDEIILNGK